MKKFLLIICILCSCIVEATDVKSIPVNIDLTGVSFPRDSYGQIKIIPPKGLFAFDSNEDYPCLPFYPVSVYIEASNSKKADIVVSSYDGTISKTIPVSANEDNVRANSTEFNKDILTITLFVDTKKADSILFNNK